MAQKHTLSPHQDLAANPLENVWVQANAGTGKTSVLVQRLLRILFRGASAANTGILCLTYTNAGAGEMRNRILGALRGWAMASDKDLIEMLENVAINKPATADDAAHAREIFFRYIDNPDMMKIKTIHGFCEEILRRFPLEAGVSPAWSLVSDASQRVLLADAFDKMINMSDNPRVADAFAHIVGRVSETYMTDLLNILSGQYKHFFEVENINKYRDYFIDTTKKYLNLDLEKKLNFDPEKLKIIINTARDMQNASKKPAKYLDDIINITQQYIDRTIDFEEYKEIYIKADGNKIQNIAKRDFLIAEQNRVYELDQQNANRILFADTVALFDLSAAFTTAYRELKRARNLLDFEDLILYTRRLFSSPENMGWILSQLDLSLSHILVDEAQDTSPMQWDILRMLSGDFFSDGATVENPHSMFVVGDTKQSIYGFQGADPNAFAASRDDIAANIKNNLRTIREVPLTQSFRSLAAILNTVDEFFGNPSVAQLTGFSNNDHACFRRGTGLVELHRLTSKQNDGADVMQYVRTIADKIKSLVDSGEYSPRDIMVLVQNRRPMAAPLVAELKRCNIDVAGSDRIVLPDFPAVRDMMNVVRFCLKTDDDYSLCCVLKSPIFRLNERDIFNICKARNDENSARRAADKDAPAITVYEILRDMHPDIYGRLNEIVKWSETCAPYSFFSNLLNTHNVRAEMISALGTQIIDPLEEFMTICLAYQRTQPGTLREFIKWFITGGSEIKRDMDASSGVRVVTVHGSKGLEAPVVFLIDTVRTPDADSIVELPNAADKYPAPWLWAPRACASTRFADAADAAMESHVAEYYRLLYVAMTRARDRLYIYGYAPHKNAPDIAWHTQLWRILAPAHGMPDDETIRITNDNTSA